MFEIIREHATLVSDLFIVYDLTGLFFHFITVVFKGPPLQSLYRRDFLKVSLCNSKMPASHLEEIPLSKVKTSMVAATKQYFNKISKYI
jgi:hypothetical protein